MHAFAAVAAWQVWLGYPVQKTKLGDEAIAVSEAIETRK
jgi:hypothetical protein